MKTVNLTIYFKSGQEVTIDRIESWSVSSKEGSIVKFSLTQKLDAKQILLMQSLDLNSIDCIIETKP